MNTFCSYFKSLKALNIEKLLEDIILSDMSQVANEIGRQRVPNTQGINHIYGAEV